MDDEQLAKLKNLIGQNSDTGPSEQDIAIDKVRRAQLSPEQRQYEDAQMMASTRQPLNSVPNAPLSSDQAALLDMKAQEARQRFDSLTHPANNYNPMDAIDQNSLQQLLPRTTGIIRKK